MARIYLVLGVAIGIAGAGCADSLECGAGTVEVDGACVPNAGACGDGTAYDEASGQCEPVTELSCAEGTLEQNGECVPDGSVICETGTTYNTDTGTCAPDITGCAEGTVLAGGECIPADDALEADVTEPAEPNDSEGTPGSFALPASGELVTIGGCITPSVDADQNGNLDPDLDAFAFSTDAPVLLDITVDGLGGLAGAFLVAPADPALVADGWARAGVNLVGDTSQATVFLPKAGDYQLVITDSRALMSGEGVGGAETCYFASVTTAAVPAPVSLAGTATGELGAPAFYAIDPGDGAALIAELSGQTEAAAAALVVMVNGEYRSTTQFGALGFPAPHFAGGLFDADEVTIVVDAAIDFSLSPVAYELSVTDESAGAAPGDGTLSLTADGSEYLYFDAAAGDVVRLSTSSPDAPFAIDVIDGRGRVLGQTPCSSVEPLCFGFLQLPDAGRYHLRVTSEALAGNGYALAVAREHLSPVAVTAGTALEDVSFLDQLYELTAAGPTWLAITVTPNGSGSSSVTGFDRSLAGFLNRELLPLFVDSLAPGVGSGRIFAPGSFLLEVNAPGSYDLAVTERAHTAVGNVVAGDAVTLPGEKVAAGEVHRYLAFVADGAEVTVTVTPGADDVVFTVLDAGENAIAVVDDGQAGGAETFTYTATGPFAAFHVSGFGGGAATYNVTIAVAGP